MSDIENVTDDVDLTLEEYQERHILTQGRYVEIDDETVAAMVKGLPYACFRIEDEDAQTVYDMPLDIDGYCAPEVEMDIAEMYAYGDGGRFDTEGGLHEAAIVVAWWRAGRYGDAMTLLAAHGFDMTFVAQVERV